MFDILHPAYKFIILHRLHAVIKKKLNLGYIIIQRITYNLHEKTYLTGGCLSQMVL